MDDIRAVNGHRLVLGVGAHGPTMGASRPVIPQDLDGPEHAKYRKILDPLFAPKKVQALEQEIRRLAAELIDSFADQGGTEVYDAFCAPLPSIIFLHLLGLPIDDYDYFIEFKDSVIPHDPNEDPGVAEQRRIRAGQRMEEYLHHEFARRAAAPPRDDLIGQLLNLEVDGQRLDHETVINMVYQLTFAGLDTVTSSLSCMIAWLADHPAERHELVSRPARMQPAVEELLRFLSPVPSTFRWPIEDIMLPSGSTIPAGTQIHASWAAANLDPDVFANPLQVDFDRPANPHIAFASGWHRCLGSHLARLELRVGLEEFHKRIPEYSISPRDQVRYSNKSVRHVKPLPLVFTASQMRPTTTSKSR